MRYLGGKSRISKDIATVINSVNLGGQEQRIFVSLFCGACSIESKIIADRKICNDLHPYLIAMWKAAQQGYQFPDIITKEQYYYIKEHKDEDPALTGFVGFGCSFGGKWFGGLAANKKGDNYCSRANRSLYKDLQGLMNAEFTCKDYREIEIPSGSLVYADPPYENSTKYNNSKDFDHKAFWEYMRQISKDNYVFISEQQAPEDFISVWSKPLKRILDVNKENIFTANENLFVYKEGLYEIHCIS